MRHFLTPNISGCLKVESGPLTLLLLTWLNPELNLREEYLWELRNKNSYIDEFKNLKDRVRIFSDKYESYRGFSS